MSTTLDDPRVGGAAGRPAGGGGAPADPPPARPRAGRREPWRGLLVALPLAVVGALLAPLFRDDIGLDGLAYVSIARQYADGHVADAVNGYWGPLWSWLLVPLLAAGVEPLLAAALLQVASAVLALLALRRLLRVAGVGTRVRDAVSLAVSPFLLAVAHYGVFVDLLLAGLLLLWCSEVLQPAFPRSRAVALRAGLWAGLAVLTKVYALPFVLVHLAVVAALHLVRTRRERGALLRVVTASGLVLAVLLALFAPWVAALSASYDRLTVTKSARYNVQIAGPGSQGNPIRYAGLLRPPNPHAVSVWEDPSAMPLDADGWSASPSGWAGPESDSASRLVRNVTDNAALGARLLREDMLAVTAVGVLGAAAVLLPLPGRRRLVPGSRLVTLGLLAAAGVYAGGYLLLFVERRYTWFLLLLPAVPAALLLQRLVRGLPGRAGTAALATAALLLAAAVGAQALPRAAAQVDEGARAQEVAAALRAAGGLPGPVASDGFWERTAVVCFELGCQYHGQPRDHELAPAVLPEVLERRGIRTFVAWGDPLPDPPGRDVTPPGLRDVHVYDLGGR